MKKNIIILIAITMALAVCAFALEVTDNSGGGTTAIGASAINKALVFNAQFDFASDAGVDGTNIVQLLNVPAGIWQTEVVMTPADISDTTTISLYRKMGTNAWAIVGGAQTVTVDAEVPIAYFISLPTFSNPQATNTVVDADMDISQNSESLALTKWGFLCVVNSTNPIPDAGTLDISVIGYDVTPSVRD